MLRCHVGIAAASVIGLGLLATGCGAASSDGGEAIQVTEQAIIVMNGLSPAYFWDPATQQALRSLVQAPLAASIDGPAGAALLASAEGEELLERVVACALPGGATLDTLTEGSFDGAIGLAPQWASAPLQGAGPRRWITACLLQSLNGLDAHVPIRLSGSHPALAGAPEAEASEYTVQDAVMFGDLFDAARPAAFACADSMPLDGCAPSLSYQMLKRLCGQTPACGITFLGHCGAVCDRDKAGAPSCSTLSGEAYPESIASSLESSSVLSLGLSCTVSPSSASVEIQLAP